jgi:hypothetical protein
MTLNVQTLMPAVVTPNSQVVLTDIDNDGFLEVIILDTNTRQLSIVHQFSYSDFTMNDINPTVWPTSDPDNTTPIWTDSTVRWWTEWATQQGLVPAPVAPGGWNIGLGDVIMAADLDGDGTQELFIYNLTTLFWGILKWNSTTNELQAIFSLYVAPNNRVVPVGQLNWGASPADQYIMFPNLHGIIPGVPANVTGILLFNTQTLYMGLIWFSVAGNQFLQPWLMGTSGAMPGWSRGGGDEYFTGTFVNTPPTLTVYNPDKYIALLTWNVWQWTTPPAQGTQAGNWGFDPADQHQCADLDGDGLTEILVFNAKTQFLGVLKWESGELQSLVVNNGTIGTAPNDWTISSDNKYYLLNIPGGSAQIFAYSPSATKVAVLAYQPNPPQPNTNASGTFVVKWAGTSLLPNNGWPVTANDSFYVGLPSQANAPRFFTLSTQGAAPNSALTLGAATWDGTNLEIVSSTPLPVPSWSPAFLGSAPPTYVIGGPPTNFQAFQGNQQDIYTYISGLFPVPGEANPLGGPPITSVRAEYSNSNYDSYFLNYGTTLNQYKGSVRLAPSSWQPPPNSAWQDNDWSTVLTAISIECTQVSGVATFFNNLRIMASDLNNFQSGDFGKVQQYITELAQSGSPSAVEYWVGQYTVALLWGLAAATGVFFPPAEAALGTALGVLLSSSASFLGSVLGYNSTQQSSLEAGQLQVQMESAFDQTIVNGGLSSAACLEDAIKLKICAGLIGNDWQIQDALPATLPALTGMDRMLMYQHLMPCYFNIPYGPMVAPPPIPSPAVLYTAPDGTPYGLQNSFNSVSKSDFLNSDLYLDLFTTIGVSEEDFFVGNGGWSLINRHYML